MRFSRDDAIRLAFAGAKYFSVNPVRGSAPRFEEVITCSNPQVCARPQLDYAEQWHANRDIQRRRRARSSRYPRPKVVDEEETRLRVFHASECRPRQWHAWTAPAESANALVSPLVTAAVLIWLVNPAPGAPCVGGIGWQDDVRHQTPEVSGCASRIGCSK